MPGVWLVRDVPNSMRSDNVPVNSVLLVMNRDEALNFQTGNISLAVCPACGFISNIAFDEALTQYTARYEATQGYSPTFNKFHQELAQDLIKRYDLHGKDHHRNWLRQGRFHDHVVRVGRKSRGRVLIRPMFPVATRALRPIV